LQSVATAPLREPREKHTSELERIRAELAGVTEALGELALRLGRLGRAAEGGEAPEASPTLEAIAFFRRMQHLQEQRTRHFGQAGFSGLGWSIALELMLARLASASCSEAELAERLGCAPGPLGDELERLVAERRVDRFHDPLAPQVARYSLAGETARRLIEFYRAREAR